MRSLIIILLISALHCPAVQVGKVVVNNQTNETFSIESRNWIDEAGNLHEEAYSWTFKPGEMGVALTIGDDDVHAARFAFRVVKDELNREDVEACAEGAEKLEINIWPRHLPKPTKIKRLYILFALDTDAAEIGDGVAKDGERLEEVIGEIRRGREDKIIWKRLDSTNLTAAAILAHYKSLKLNSDDAVLFVYSGHGGTDQNGHFLALTYGVSLHRHYLRSAIEATGASLQVIVTNACSNIAGVTPPNRRIPAEWEVFKSLFFQSQGLVDITAAEDGTPAWISPVDGGFFTQSFTHLLCEPVSHSDENQDGQVTWQEFFSKVKEQTNNLFLLGQQYDGPDRGDKDIRNYTDQTPAYFYLGDATRWRFFLKGGDNYYNVAIRGWEANKNVHETLQVLGKLANSKGTLKVVADAYDEHAARLGAIRKQFEEAEKCYKLGATIAFAQGEYDTYKSLIERRDNAVSSKNAIQSRVDIHRTNAGVYRATASISR